MYNPFSLERKKILIAGASSGIGRSIAIECSKLGAVTYLLGRNIDKLNESVNLMKGFFKGEIISKDITCEEDLNKVIDILPSLDGLSYNIGYNKTSTIKFLKPDNITKILDVNVMGAVNLVRNLIVRKKFNRGASIVFTTSLSGIYSVHYGDSLNAISKGALNAFAKSAALDLSSQGIRVNCVNPGIISTEAAFKGTILTEEEMLEKQKFFPLKRFGNPLDVAYAVIYLLSDASTWITGINMPVDGGYLLI